MQVKVFQDIGARGIQAVEEKANQFLATLDDVAVVSVTPSMCTGGGGDEGELYQCYAMTIVYRRA